MDYIKLKEKVCRICLEHNVIFNWNDEIISLCGVSYKDCYYKYTRLKETDPDCYPQNFCGKCAKEVRNAYILFEKALESFIILENALKAKGSKIYLKEPLHNSEDITENCTIDENYFIESKKEEKSQFEIDEVTFPLALDDEIEQIKNSDNSCEEIGTNEIGYIKSIKYSFNPLHEQPIDVSDIQLLKPTIDKKAVKKKKTLRIRGNKLLESTDKISKISVKEQQNKRLCKKSVRRGTVQHILRTERSKDFNQRKFMKSRLVSSELSMEKTFEGKKQIREICENNLLEPILKESENMSSLAFSSSSSFTKIERINDSSANSLLETRLDEVATVSPSPYIINSFESIEPQSSLESNYSFEEKTNERSQNSLSQEKVHDDENTEGNSSRVKTKRYHLCQYCSYKTPDKRSLLDHETKHLDNRERNIICSKCSVKFYTKDALRCHMETHNENRTRKHKCEFCEKAFFGKGSLNVHRRIHLGLMFKCQICQMEFFRQLDLDRHLLKHSVTPARNNVEKKQYAVECQYCNKTVLTRKLKEHMAVHLNKPQAKCKICDKDFFTKSRCTSHLRRFHKINSSEYVKYTHNYVKVDGRACFLKIRQENQVKLITK